MREKDYYGAIKGFCLKWNLPEVWNSDRITGANLIYEVIKVINAMIVEQKEVKEMVEDFLRMFDEDLDETIRLILTEWLNDGTLGDVINETLFNSKLDKSVFDDFLITYNNIIKGENSILNYGVVPNVMVDSYDAFIQAFETCDVLTIPVGTYYISKELKVLPTHRIKKIVGQDRTNTKLIFTSGGLTINKEWFSTKGMYLIGDDEGNENTGSGLKIDGVSWQNHEDIRISGFNIGVDLLTSEEYIITAKFKDIVSSANVFAGFAVKSIKTNERNVITFENCYANRNGSNYLDNTALAETDKGYGYYFEGSNGVLLTSCVSEYNTGCGIYVTNKNHDVLAYTQINHWFEGNKYAQLYIDNVNTYNAQGLLSFRDFTTIGSYYGQGAYAVPSNGISERRAFIKDKFPIIVKPFNNISVDGINYASIISEVSSIDPRNMIPQLNNLEYLKDKETNMRIWQGEWVFIMGDVENTTTGSYPVNLMSDTTYRVEIDYYNTTGLPTSNLDVIVQTETGDVINVKSYNVDGWKDEFTRITHTFYNKTPKKAVIHIQYSGGTSSVFVKNIRLILEQRGLIE